MKKVDHAKSKRYKEISKQIDKEQKYPLDEAITLIKKTSTVKFDASVEAHFNLNINPKKSDQQIRSSASLPHGTGKDIKIAVVALDGDEQKAAKEAGANLVGEKDLVDEIKKGNTNFDILVASPDAMKILAPAAKILGPKGMMPNPKDGTVTQNIAETVADLKKGKLNYRNDDSGNIHAIVGKISFDNDKLKENFLALKESLIKDKPTGLKGIYIKNISLSSSMGPGIKVEI